MSYLKRIIRMIYGSLIFSFGTMMVMDSNIGYGPWEVLHGAIADQLGVKIGTIAAIVGVLLVVVDLILKEAVGISTIVSTIITGKTVDMWNAIMPHPVFHHYIFGMFYMILGMFVVAFGTFCYIRAELGTGPRDGIMVAIRRHLKLPVGVSRFALEMLVALIGWAMGGHFGLGTLIYALGLGTAIQTVFTLFRFETTSIKHENLLDSWRHFQAWRVGRREKAGSGK